MSKRQKTSKNSKGVSLACNPVEVAEKPLLTSTHRPIPEEATNTGNGKDVFYTTAKEATC